MKDLDQLKQLREETGVSYSVCRNALDEAKGDIEKARSILKKQGAEVAKKKAERATNQGSVFSYIHHNTKIGAMVVVLCETDFVAKNDSFKTLGNDIAMHIASTDPADLKELMSSPFIKDPKITIEDLMKQSILKIGENLTISEFVRYEIG